MTPTPIGDLLELVVGPEAHATAPGRHPGGEWDPWRALTRKQRRRLIGAGFARSTALEPDVLADMIRNNHPGLDGQDPLEWYFRTALAAIAERQSARNRDRHRRLAAANGFASYYAYRNWLCLDAGLGTLWAYRRSRGWQ